MLEQVIYILLKSVESDVMTYADLYAIKFITISNRSITPYWNQTNNYGFNDSFMTNPNNNMFNRY